MNTLDPQMLDALPDAVLVVEADGTIKMANYQAELTFGYKRADLIGKSVEMLFPERLREAHARHRESLLTLQRHTPEGSAIELYGQSSEGREFPLEACLSALSVETQTIVVSVIRDLTKQKSMSERRFLALFQQTNHLIGIVDLKGALLDVNAAALDYSGLLKEDVIGLSFWNTGWWAHSEPLRQQLQQAIKEAAQGKTTRFEASHPRSDGSLGFVEFSIRPVRGDDDAVAFLVAESHDVSAHKDVEEQMERAQAHADALLEANNRAVAATESKSRFLAAASHDLRQPLQSAGLYLGVIERKLNQWPAQSVHQLSEVSKKLRQSLDNMGELINSLLDVSLLDSGSITPNLCDFKLSEMFERVVTDNIQQAEHKGLVLSHSGGDCCVHSDPALLARVVENLVANAISFTDRGTVYIECQQLDAEVMISVRDTGLGIPDDQTEKLFEEYYQLDNPARERTKGIGFGLSIVKHIAQLLKHPLTVTSTPGQGSSFSITVPSAEGLALNVINEGHPPAICGSSLTVLLIDDDPGVLDSTGMLLESAGMTVCTARNSDEALTLLKDDVSPSIIVTDYWLPGCDGLELVSRVRSRTSSSLPAILVTGDILDVEKHAKLPSGCTVLYKPVGAEELITAVKCSCESLPERVQL